MTKDGEVIDAAWDLFKRFYLDPRKRTVTLCWELVHEKAAQAGWTWPALRTIQMRVARELPPAVSDLWRLGDKAWDRAHAPRIQRDYTVFQSLGHWVGDQHTFDVLVLHNGKPIRPVLTAWIDMRSRLLVGWTIRADGNTDTILAAFRIAAKEYGLPNELTVDNGPDYASNALANDPNRPRYDESRLTGLFPRLSIDLHFCIPFSPQSKLIERFFRTVSDRFSRLWDAWVGNKPDTRPETLYKDLRAGKIEPPSLDSFASEFSRWVREVYHLLPHEGDGMNGRTPAEVAAIDPIAKRTAPDAQLDLLMMRRVKATATRRGVQCDGILYGQQCEPLWKMHGRKVELGIDDSDRSYVLVFDEKGEFVARVEQQRLAGVTQDEVREGKRLQARAKRLAKQAGPALLDRHKSVTDLALELSAKRAERMSADIVAATGTCDSRPLKIAGDFGPTLEAAADSFGARRPIEPPSMADSIPLDFGDDGADSTPAELPDDDFVESSDLVFGSGGEAIDPAEQLDFGT